MLIVHQSAPFLFTSRPQPSDLSANLNSNKKFGGQTHG